MRVCLEKVWEGEHLAAKKNSLEVFNTKEKYLVTLPNEK